MALGDTFYAILGRYADGSYFQLGETAFGSDFYFFPTPESTINVYVQGVESQSISEVEFVNLVTELSGESPASPRPDSLYPATAPLIITTSTGTDYLLPLDGGEPSQISEDILREVVFQHYMSHSAYSGWGERLYFALSECPDIDCFTFASSGLNTAFQPNNDRILLTWGWQTELEGQEILFSPQAEAAAVWNENTLNIYLLRYALSSVEPQEMEDNPQLIGSVILETSTNTNANYAVWSPDARLIVYSDVNGLWAWDVLADESPQLLIPTTDNVIPYARYFSPRGRYLAITEGQTNYNLDLISGEELPDGTFSANDSLLLTLTPHNVAPGFYSFSIQQIAPPATYTPFIEGTIVREAVWLDEQRFAAVRCVPDEGIESCDFLNMNVNGQIQMGDDGPLVYQGYSIVVQNETFAAIVDRDTLLFNGTEINVLLDSDIAEIRWLPSLFYDSPFD